MTLWIIWSVLVSTLIALAATAIDRVAASLGLPRRFVWLGAMLCAALLPLAIVIRPASVPSAASEVPAPITRVVPVMRERSATELSGPHTAATPIPTVPIQPPSARRRANDDLLQLARIADPWIARLWLAASLVLITVGASAMLRTHRQAARWHEAELGSCQTLVSPDVGPAIVGFARPRIVIPTWALSLEPSARDLMLRHETEHITARDPAAILAAGVLVVAFPWNVALWWMVRRLRLSIEMDCDARVVRAMGRAHEYGMVLLAIGERRTVSLPFAAALTDARPNLERRIDAMIAQSPRRPLIASMPYALIALLAVTGASKAPRPPAPIAPITFAPRAIAAPIGAILRPTLQPNELGRPGTTATAPNPMASGVTYTIHYVTPDVRIAFESAGVARAPMPDEWSARVVWAHGRGRMDIIDGMDVRFNLSKGDYILFDSTDFIIVRPGKREFAGVIPVDLLARSLFGEPSDSAGQYDSLTVTRDSLGAVDLVAGQRTRHYQINVRYTHVEHPLDARPPAHYETTTVTDCWLAEPEALPPNPFMRAIVEFEFRFRGFDEMQAGLPFQKELWNKVADVTGTLPWGWALVKASHQERERSYLPDDILTDHSIPGAGQTPVGCKRPVKPCFV